MTNGQSVFYIEDRGSNPSPGEMIFNNCSSLDAPVK